MVWDEEATFVLTWTVGQGVLVCSRMTIPTRRPRRGLGESITRNPKRRIAHTLLLLGTVGGRRWSFVPSRRLLRLASQAGVGQKVVSGKGMTHHHIFVKIGLCFWINRFCCCSIDYLGGSVGPFNRNVHSTTSRNLLGRFVSNWGEVLCGSITKAKVPSFTSS